MHEVDSDVRVETLEIILQDENVYVCLFALHLCHLTLHGVNAAVHFAINVLQVPVSIG